MWHPERDERHVDYWRCRNNVPFEHMTRGEWLSVVVAWVFLMASVVGFVYFVRWIDQADFDNDSSLAADHIIMYDELLQVERAATPPPDPM